MRKIIVASKNPVKLKAVQDGFAKMFAEQKYDYLGVSVPSGVADQPMTDEETYRGAWQRVQHAKAEHPNADYWVGLEGGIAEQDGRMMAFAWIIVEDKERMGEARTGAFFLPPKVVELIKEGKELGEADDIVFGHSNSKQQGGAVGLLTDNTIDRAKLYSESVILALIPFRNPTLY